MENIKTLIEIVNSTLHANEPHNISVDTHSGYIGYKPQSIIDAMNEVFDIGTWGFEEISNTIEPGDKGGLAIAQVKVWIKDVEFRPTGWGQNRVTRGDTGDARKGAQTDAIKKALSYYSIGNRAYLGLLVDPEKNNQHQGQRTSNPQQARPQAPTTPVKPVAQPATPHVGQALSERDTGMVKSEPPTPSQLRKECQDIYGSDRWEAVMNRLGFATKSDDDLTPADCQKVANALATVRARRQAA